MDKGTRGEDAFVKVVILATCRDLGGEELPTDPSLQLVTIRFPGSAVGQVCWT